MMCPEVFVNDIEFEAMLNDKLMSLMHQRLLQLWIHEVGEK